LEGEAPIERPKEAPKKFLEEAEKTLLKMIKDVKE